MPFEIMDQRGVSVSSHLFDEIPFPAEVILCLVTMEVVPFLVFCEVFATFCSTYCTGVY